MPAAVPYIAIAAEALGISQATVFVITAAAAIYQHGKLKRQEQRAIDAYNSSLQDRLLTLRSGVSERRYVVGTVRVGGTLMYADTVGLNKSALDSVIALACNKCELTDYYFGDERVPLAEFPGDHFGQQQEIDAEEEFTVTGPAGTINLSVRPKAGTLKVLEQVGTRRGLVDVNATLAPTGTQVSFSGINAGTRHLVVTYKIDGSTRIRATYKDGDPNQTPSTWPDHITPMWTAEHLLKGVAHLRTLMLWDENLFAAGAPVVGAVLKGGWIDGHPFYDPRTGTNPVYTDNPAILAGWWMTLARSRGGCGIPSTWIDWATIAVAANLCDELVTVKKLTGSGTEQIKRYQCHAVLTTAADPLSNLQIILSAMGGRRVFTGGLYRIVAGAFRPATITIRDADVVGTKPISCPTGGGEDAPANVVTARFPDMRKNWQESSPPPVRNPTYITADGGEEALDIALPGTTDPRQAGYLMGIALESGRPAFTVLLSVGGIGENICLLDCVQLSLSNRPTYAGKTYEVVGITDNDNGEFDLVLSEIRAQTWALDLNTFTPAAPITLPDLSYLWNPQPITGLAVDVGDPQVLPDGNAITVVGVTWNALTQPYMLDGGHVEARYRVPGFDWISVADMPPDATGTELTASLSDGSIYQFQVRAVNGIGARSNWSDVFVDITGTSLAAGSQGPGIFTWAGPVGVVTTSSSIRKTGSPLFANGGFESGTSTGWSTSFAGAVVTGNARTGSFSARVASGVGGPNLITDRWASIPGQVWQLDAWVKRDEASLPTNAVQLSGRAYNSALVNIGQISIQNANPAVVGWQKLTGTFTAPAGTAFVALDVGEAAGTGAWFVDDAAAGPSTWAAGAYSLQSYSTGCFASMRAADTTTSKMFGLNNDPDIDANFTGINFAWRADDSGNLQIYENGILLSAQGTYTVQTILGINYDGVNVRYTKDGTTVRTVAASGLRLFLDTSLFTIGAEWQDATFGPMGPAGADGVSGAPAQSVRLSASAYVFTYDAAGAPAPAGQSILFTASRQNIVTAVTYSTTPPGVALTGSGDTRTLTAANFGASTSVKVRVDVAGVFDEITVVRLQQGATGPSAIQAIATNQNHTFPADPDGVVTPATLAAANGLLFVFEGTIDRTSLATLSVVSPVNCTVQINTATNTPVAGQPKGFYRVTSLTADTGSATLRAVYNGNTRDVVMTLSKARQGIPGDGANLLHVDEWVVGTNGNQGTHWSAIGSSAAESGIVLGGAGSAPLGPLGITEPLWETRSLDTNASPAEEPDGGWEYGAIPVDHQKSHRSTCWFRINQLSGNLYHGCDTVGSTFDLGGGVNTNPYFAGVTWAGSGLEPNQWYLSVGVVHGSGYAGGYSGIAGIYDPRTGKKVVTGTEYRMAPGATVQRHRAYHFYDPLTTTKQWMARPRFEEVNGNEPSIQDLMGIHLPVPWIERGNCFAALSSFHKVGGVSAWDSDIISIQSFTNCHLQIRPGQTSGNFMVGLNTDPYANQSYETIDFAWYCHPAGLQIYENGVLVGDFGTYTTATELSISYDGTFVRYYKDRGNAVRTVAVAGARFYLDSSFYSPIASCLAKWGPGITFETIGTAEIEQGGITQQAESAFAGPITNTANSLNPGGSNPTLHSFVFTPTGDGVSVITVDAVIELATANAAGPPQFSFGFSQGANSGGVPIEPGVVTTTSQFISRTASFALLGGIPATIAVVVKCIYHPAIGGQSASVSGILISVRHRKR